MLGASQPWAKSGLQQRAAAVPALPGLEEREVGGHVARAIGVLREVQMAGRD